ncbi:MAG: hypothetical protein WCD70_11235 [Alphaproteobacteria bacterium]
MTAEISVMNKSGVALAADSKATVRIQGVIKTHDTANKLFTLSKYHPVGIMINGNAEFMQTPWETLIKIYREKLKAKCLPVLEKYLDDFCLALVADYGFSEESQEINAYFLFCDFLAPLLQSAQECLKQGKTPDEALNETIASYNEQALSTADCQSLSGISSENIISLYSEEIDVAIADNFGGVDEIKRSQLREYLSKIILKDVFSGSCSEVVIAGYGNDEIFPSVKAYRVDGIIAGKLKFAVSHERKITIGKEGCASDIHPFAQREMVDRFMLGVDPIYARYMEHGFNVILRQVIEGLVQKLAAEDSEKKTQILEQVQKGADTMMEKFFGQIHSYSYKAFAKPVLDMTQLLPKEELAHLAESLVNLTSFKRRMSLDAESVGGPIDVAVISKGDGFVWIKRKHYFNIEFNRSFMDNYFRNHIDGKGETAHDRRKKRAE